MNLFIQRRIYERPILDTKTYFNTRRDSFPVHSGHTFSELVKLVPLQVMSYN
jgi:hypothetical protein